MQARIPEVTLLEEVGRGPGSVVFRALHRGAGCVVKLPSDSLPNIANQSTTFEQDMLQLARLSRAGLPRVLQLGATVDTPYAILDQAQGEPLSSVLRRPLTDLTVLDLSRALTTCLQRLHEAGFVHGSLTAEQVLCSEQGTRVTLVDNGSMSRPIPFDSRSDARALGTLLRDCARQIQGPSKIRASMLGLADELVAGKRAELAWVVAELDALADAGRKRRSSYPPPSRESLAISSTAPSIRRARSELSLLRRFWDHAPENGGKLVEVLGPAGSGKSRLLGVFSELVGEEHVQVLSVKCRDSDWAPFSALKRLLEGHLAGLAYLEPERRTQIEQTLRDAAGPMASRIRLLSPRLAALMPEAQVTLAEGDAQQVFVAGMAEFLATYLEASGPSVLVIDDIHWLDASSRMVISRLAARLCAKGHLLVCGARDDEDSREPLERFRSMIVPELTETIRLGPLSERDASDIVSDYLGLDRKPDRDLVQQLSQLSDGTPLSLLELLRITLERGYLRPRWGHWYLDATPVQRMRLPASSQALIRRRLAALDLSTLDVLRAAAIIRNRIDVSWLARVNDMTAEGIVAALDRAVAARLLEKDPRGEYCFVHDCVWEELLRSVPEAQRRILHERAADALYNAHGRGADYEYELARHHAAGIIELKPRRAYDAMRRAAQRALEACDDALALSFLKPAEDAARCAGIDPDRDFYVQLAESSLRTGASRESRDYFERALVRSRPGFERAHVRARLAWMYHYESNEDACWRMLEAALTDLGRPLPNEHPRGVLAGASEWIAGSLGVTLSKLPREEAETLCVLYTECVRVAIETGMPGRAMASALQLANTARLLPPCRARVYGDMLMAVFVSITGAYRLAESLSARAELMAREIGDPIALTLWHQLRHVMHGWRGELDECARHARICVEERHPFMELGELCHICFAMYGIDLTRGRPMASLVWLDIAVERVRQHGRAPAIFTLIEEAACNTLLILGREKDVTRLKRNLQFVECARIQPGSYFHQLGYQSRLQYYTERGDLGAGFEALVSEFDRLNLDPKQVHALVHIYYIHLAHARVHQCLRAEPGRRALLLPKLERAMRTLEPLISRQRACEGHYLFVKAAHTWFHGSRDEAESLLVAAEKVANDYDVPWVSYASARLRAHILRAHGKLESAHNHARVAALLARRYGHMGWLRFIREEFELPESPEPQRNDVDAPYTRRHLAALLRISQANSRELGPERQARLILDELIEALGAERALLFMRRDAPGTFALAAARSIGGCDLELSADYDHALVEQVYASGQTQLADTDHLIASSNRACVVVALVLREQAVGALYLDRSDAAGSFRPEDAALLQALANQVPVALELAGALRERERLQQNLRQAQKMEAIGRFAGGIAHDFNNILATIQFAAEGLATILSRLPEGRDELNEIQESARRGTELTRQLLTFSRGNSIPLRPLAVNEIVREITSTLRRLVRPNVSLELDVPEVQLLALGDPSQFERVMMNLCQNASDAMPHGGTIAIRVCEARLVRREPPAIDAEPEDYVLLTVTDTGAGMTEEVRARLFEPFFTTKTGGTGLGLANVYAIVQQCGGEIEVASEPGVGSTFRIYLPRVELGKELEAAAEASPEARALVMDEDDLGVGTVLIVDDDEDLRARMVQALEGAGYQVLSAPDGPEALSLVDALDGLLDIAITCLHMSDMDGVQLADALLSRDPDVKLLFVSGEEPDETQLQELRDRNGTFLEKPFDEQVLLDKVSVMLRIPPGAIRGH
jgi:eukaryotic-like serine/threonine-protein kinase